jgi:hypothetical protein
MNSKECPTKYMQPIGDQFLHKPSSSQMTNCLNSSAKQRHFTLITITLLKVSTHRAYHKHFCRIVTKITEDKNEKFWRTN